MRLGRSAARGGQAVHVDLTRRVRGWAPSRRELARWAAAALGRRASGAEIAVRVVGPGESRGLNARFRGRDRPTNVLSFPVSAAARNPAPAGARAQRPPRAPARPLGDLVICAQVLRREAAEQGKTLRAHWAHLVVHGTLHLAGYDHARSREAERMERREIRVLRRFGFGNPYRAVRADG